MDRRKGPAVRRRQGQCFQLRALQRDRSLCQLPVRACDHERRAGVRGHGGLAADATCDDVVCSVDCDEPPRAAGPSSQRRGRRRLDRRDRRDGRAILVRRAPSGFYDRSRWRNCAASEHARATQKGCRQAVSPIRSGRRNAGTERFAAGRPIQTMSVDLSSFDAAAVAVSIVVPVRNEAENISPLVAEIAAALDGRWNYEIIYVNDGSTDATADRLAAVKKQRGNLREIRHAISAGQSAAVRSGVRAARGAIVATLDGDGQNNPAFLPDLIAAIERGGDRVGLAAGQRVGRKDTGFKKIQSRIANRVRSAILQDGTRDTGCGLKAFRREVFLMMPYFDGLHRFLPALMRREGYEIAYVDVVDRPRHSGVSNYGFFDRLWIGIMDLACVWGLIRRKNPTPIAIEV